MNNVLPMAKWGTYETTRITKLFKGFESDWEKASLKSVKESLKNELFPKQNYECAYCRRRIINEIGRVEVDHILPKATYPHFTFERINLVLTCKRCNHSKGQHDSYVGTGSISAYPCVESSFKWVHPYFHLYSEHISIDQAGVYSAVGCSINGLEVITKCKLDTLKRVVENHEIAELDRISDLNDAILKIVGDFPLAANKQIVAIFQATCTSAISEVELLELIEILRGANSVKLLKLLAKL